MIITSLRTYEKNFTSADVYVNGEVFDDSLEDCGRAAGVKVQNETCIPEGTYYVGISASPKFGREMLVIYNTKEDHSINRLGVRFTGIRCHDGNNIEHTAGCPLMSKWESLLSTVRNELNRDKVVKWVFTEDV